MVYQRNVDIFHQGAFGDITSSTSKLRTYGLIKSEIGEEPYLRMVKNVKDRISITKFRLSNHKLMIEKSRHQNTHKDLRICPFCTAVEDEIHFLTNCHTFRYIRAILFEKVEEVSKIRNIKDMDAKSLFKLLLEQENTLQIVAKYLSKAMELRDFLIGYHRQFI